MYTAFTTTQARIQRISEVSHSLRLSARPINTITETVQLYVDHAVTATVGTGANRRECKLVAVEEKQRNGVVQIGDLKDFHQGAVLSDINERPNGKNICRLLSQQMKSVEIAEYRYTVLTDGETFIRMKWSGLLHNKDKEKHGIKFGGDSMAMEYWNMVRKVGEGRRNALASMVFTVLEAILDPATKCPIFTS
ncbi:hypothetical protein EXIGLDRAFT_500373 [Exidia glandulosa HHB12029]|uniref:Uncharacterized protein n=1 Tax=Exidia glandulosa HHB12029 TaxID=1314781 RepID=A0A165JDB8_EXIGL|nr:hypothetical protein EXIGLDRAFT_500373 [Exidia glandulosa HHB12029]